jgi:hypothetical protein|tara:strand:- start:2822 stop:3028 length:207 start_codon:yes stop_codon:yes gene_type:complete
MDMDLEEQYFAELVDEEELPPEFYSWLKDLSKLNNRKTSFFIALALEEMFIRFTQGPDFPEEHAITHH